MRDEIVLQNDHGTFVASGIAIDLTIAKYLPASVNDLAGRANDILGTNSDYSDIHSVSEFVVMFADAQYTSSDPVAAYATYRDDFNV